MSLLLAMSEIESKPVDIIADNGPLPRIVLADDHPGVREWLCLILKSGFDVVGIFGNGRDLLDAFDDLQPDAILLDISMPEMNGFVVAVELRERVPRIPVIFVTQHAESPYIAEALRIGVAGYVLKRNVLNDLPVAIREVLRGGAFLSPALRPEAV